jgi:hypothetical protein
MLSEVIVEKSLSNSKRFLLMNPWISPSLATSVASIKLPSSL